MQENTSFKSVRRELGLQSIRQWAILMFVYSNYTGKHKFTSWRCRPTPRNRLRLPEPLPLFRVAVGRAAYAALFIPADNVQATYVSQPIYTRILAQISPFPPSLLPSFPPHLSSTPVNLHLPITSAPHPARVINKKNTPDPAPAFCKSDTSRSSAPGPSSRSPRAHHSTRHRAPGGRTV